MAYFFTPPFQTCRCLVFAFPLLHVYEKISSMSYPHAFYPSVNPVIQMQQRTSVGVLGVLGGALCHLVLGTTYCWGNFVPYVPGK